MCDNCEICEPDIMGFRCAVLVAAEERARDDC